jgi:hypothetical protein
LVQGGRAVPAAANFLARRKETHRMRSKHKLEAVRESLGTLGDGLGDVADRVDDAVDDAKDTLSEARDNIEHARKHGTRRARKRVRRTRRKGAHVAAEAQDRVHESALALRRHRRHVTAVAATMVSVTAAIIAQVTNRRRRLDKTSHRA